MEHLDSAAGKPDRKKRVVLIGVGGASCSGKTTLAKHLQSVLPGSFIIHQDDFAPPEQQVPYHPTLNIRDWDDPVGAIDWPRMVKFIREVRQNATLREDWKSHDPLNPQTPVPLPDELIKSWAARFEDEKRMAEERGEEIIWALVDGFLLYWNPDIVRELDIRLFLQVPYKTLKHRRDNRYGYHTAVLFQPEGSWWQDPPGYWDDIVWPAFIKAHRKMFQNNDIEHGKPFVPPPPPIRKAPIGEEQELDLVVNGMGTPERDRQIIDGKDEQICGEPVDRLNVFDAENMGMEQLFITACERILGGTR